MNGIWIDQQAAATLLPSACDDARPTAIGERADARRARVPCHAQAAGAALLTDYILTVSVSVASGVAQMDSAFPLLQPYRALISVVCIVFIMIINLRGVKESGKIFAVPTYFFIVMMYCTLGVAFFRY